jgi:hypothetical protein
VKGGREAPCAAVLQVTLTFAVPFMTA